MLELIKDFLHDRTTATTWIRTAITGFAMFVVGHEEMFPDWFEITMAVLTGGAMLTSSTPKEVKSERIERERVQP